MAAPVRHEPHVQLLWDPFDHTKKVLYHELTGEKHVVSSAYVLHFQDGWGYISDGSSTMVLKNVFKSKCFVLNERFYVQDAEGPSSDATK